MGYEKKDVNVRMVIMVTVSLVVLIVGIGVILNEYFLIATEELVYEQILKPESAALRDLRAVEEETLNSYRLLDAEQGKYRIPIRRAMELMADEAYRTRD